MKKKPKKESSTTTYSEPKIWSRIGCPKIFSFSNRFDSFLRRNSRLFFLPNDFLFISSGKVIGLSKLNRIVQYYAKRPQVQERLTNQIAEDLKLILGTDDVAVIIDAKHLCVSSRGIKDESSATVTSYYGGKFNTTSKIAELQNYLKD